MANGVAFQNSDPATPPRGTTIKTTKTNDGHVQHVNVDTIPTVGLESSTDPIGTVEITSIAAGDNNTGNPTSSR